VLHNDTDVDGDSLTASVAVAPAHGLLVLNPNGTFHYTPDSGYSGDDSFTYKPNDGTTLGNETVVSIKVHAPPTVQADSYVTSEDDPVVIADVQSGVLANDTTSQSQPIEATLVDQASHGHVDLAADGTFTYSADLNFNGTDTFTYTASDGFATSSVATVTIMVNPVNDAPVAANDSYIATQDTLLSVPLATGVLSNDHDVDNATLTAILFSQPSHGQLTPNSNGTFDYMPDSLYTGPDSFTYSASDGTLTTQATVTIDVHASGEGEAFDAALLSLLSGSTSPSDNSSYAAAVDYLMATLG
jgi:VCBS repeat-containing protein